MRTWLLAVVLTVGCKADAEKQSAVPEPTQTPDDQRSTAISSTPAPRLVTKGRVDPKQEEARKGRLNNTLLRADKNGDGSVTVAELADTELDYLKFDDFNAVDRDQNGTISVDELDAAIEDRRQKSRARWEDELRR